MDNKYKLTPEQFDKDLKMAELAVFMKGKSVEEARQPYSVYVVAQPGAGKTGLRAFVESEYQEERARYPFIEFNPDEIAIYHEYYREILQEFPGEAYKMLQEFVSPALDKYLKPKAVKLRNNIIQEGTLANTKAYLDILRFQKHGGVAEIGNLQDDGTRQEETVDGGYYVDINLIAVHRYESLLSSYEREQYFRETGLPPRAVTAENHDRAYTKILETMESIEQEHLYDRIRIFRRGEKEFLPELVYDSTKDKSEKTIRQLITDIREQNKKELFENPQEFLNRIKNLKERAMKNGIPAQIERIEMLEREFLRELAQHLDGQEH